MAVYRRRRVVVSLVVEAAVASHLRSLQVAGVAVVSRHHRWAVWRMMLVAVVVLSPHPPTLNQSSVSIYLSNRDTSNLPLSRSGCDSGRPIAQRRRRGERGWCARSRRRASECLSLPLVANQTPPIFAAVSRCPYRRHRCIGIAAVVVRKTTRRTINITHAINKCGWLVGCRPCAVSDQ